MKFQIQHFWGIIMMISFTKYLYEYWDQRKWALAASLRKFTMVSISKTYMDIIQVLINIRDEKGRWWLWWHEKCLQSQSDMLREAS